MSELATFGAGCFWHVEAAFAKLDGVLKTTVGYMGGTTPDPTYEEVCTDLTGHAEVVQVRYDPAVISYEALLGVFFEIHDPTTLNRQGPDVGSQYRSVIFCHTQEQERIAQALKEDLNRSAPIVTQISPASTFTPAEDYHQRYFEKHGICGSS